MHRPILTAAAFVFVACGGGHGDAGGAEHDAGPRPLECGPPCAGTPVQVAAGLDHSCARYDTGGVVCWGAIRGVKDDSSVFVSANQGGLDEIPPLAVPEGLSDVTDITAGDAHSCAIKMGGALWCWGRNDLGQIGQPDSKGQYLVPVPVLDVRADDEPPKNPKPLVVPWAKAFGNSTFGALPDGHSFYLIHDVYVDPTLVIESGRSNLVGCDILQDHSVRCYGVNNDGGLGNGVAKEETAPETYAIPTSLLPDAVSIAGGQVHLCALRRSGHVACWGRNLHSQLGLPADELIHAPTDVPGISDAVLLRATDLLTCIVRKTGQLVCWGSNWSNVFRIGDVFEDRGPTPVANAGDLIDVSMARDHGCIVRRSGEVACWGFNNFGQVTPHPHQGNAGDLQVIHLP
jgi:alpha-tubulin suppressor-like RCC1 family protein